MLGSKTAKLAREQAKQEAKARRRGRVVVIALVLTAVIATAPVVIVGAAVCAALMFHPDRLWAKLVAAVGLLPFLGAVSLASGYVAAVESVYAGQGGAEVLAGYGLAAGPFVGGLAAIAVQRHREASPLRGAEIKERRQSCEDDRRRRSTHFRQKVAYGQEKGGRTGHFVQRATEATAVPLGSEQGPYLGKYLRGDLPWNRRGKVQLPDSHLAVFGGTQLGKSETVHRLTEWAMQWRPEGQVIYLNAKEAAPGKEPSRRLAAHAESLAKTYNVLVPGYRPFDIMRGTRSEVRQRLMDVELFSEPHHEAGTNLVLALGLEMLASEGRAQHELVEMVQQVADRDRVKEWAGRSPFAARLVEMIDLNSWRGAVTRYASDALDLAGWIGTSRVGGFGLEDADVTAIDLPTSTEPKSAAMLLRMALQDITAYLTSDRRKRLSNGEFAPLTVVMEELSAVDRDPIIGRRVVNLMERALGSNARFIVVSQDPGGLGDDRAQEAVLTNSTLISFGQVTGAETIARAAGTRRVPEASGSYQSRWVPDELSDSGSKRMQDQFAINPNELRQLERGECFVVHRGKYAKCAATMSQLGYGVPKTDNIQLLDQQWAKARQEREIEQAEGQHFDPDEGEEGPLGDK